MAILVHRSRATHNWLRAGVRKGDRMYHVLSDQIGPEGSRELRSFVARFGLRPEWIQYRGSYREHYDVRADTGLEMLASGARPATNREVGRLLAAKKATMSQEDGGDVPRQRPKENRQTGLK
jgi:hypothetical protein